MPRKECVKENKNILLAKNLAPKNNSNERIYYYGKGTEGNTEGVCGVSGRYSLRGEGKSPVTNEDSVRGFWYYHVRYKGHLGCMDWGAREQ